MANKKTKKADEAAQNAEKQAAARLAAIREFNLNNAGEAWIDPDKIPTEEDVNAAKKEFEERTIALRDKNDYLVADEANAVRVAKFLKKFIENGFWQGTIVYMEITTSREIDPNEVVDHRTNADEQYNESFVETDDLESLWTGKGTTEFKFSSFGTDFGTRDMGAKIREQIRPLIEKGECVVLDFTGVNVVSNSFADECIAKLLLDHTLQSLKQHITFKGLNEMANRSILVALQRRYKMMS